VHVLLTLSHLGALTLVNRTVIHSFYCGPVEEKTTVGAGDSFLGGFVTSYVESDRNNIETALRAGVTTAVARLQGQHREFGYIDQEKIREVYASRELKLEKFKDTEAAEYVKNNLLQCFPCLSSALNKVQAKAQSPRAHESACQET